MEEHGLPEYDAGVITSSLALAEFFDATLKKYPDAKTISNWIMGELLRLLNAHNMELSDAKITPGGLASLLQLIEKGSISNKWVKRYSRLCSRRAKNRTKLSKKRPVPDIRRGAVEPDYC